MKISQLARLATHAALAVLPSAIKRPIYNRVFGFRIAPTAKIGLSILDVDHLEMEDGAKIGHGNLLHRTEHVHLGRGAEIGYGNLVRGGAAVELDEYSTVLRFNVLNSIPDNDCQGSPDPRLVLGKGAYVVSGHRLDFTDRITLGKNVIVAGRNSSFWTHNRQETRPIEIGDFSYVGSEVRIAPGARLGDESILVMGAVLAGQLDGGKVSGGVPAKPIREVTSAEKQTLHRPSRKDVPPGTLDD